VSERLSGLWNLTFRAAYALIRVLDPLFRWTWFSVGIGITSSAGGAGPDTLPDERPRDWHERCIGGARPEHSHQGETLMAEIRPKVMLDDPMARTAGSTATTQPSTATEEETHPLADAGHQATQTAGHLAERAADLGLRQADRGRGQAAEGIDQVAQGIRRLSTDLQLEQPAIAGAAETAAEQAERIAQYLRDNDARQTLSQVEEAARRQPLLFLGGAFVLGVAVSRFLKAAGGRTSDVSGSFGSDRFYDYRATGPGSSTGSEEA
jgi:hypothetical protein